mmetsp:Transcript_35414/g.84570  ORF Transcript_35414/g.84570 Transcript_35414/m.84570 type:complete len:286 (+) Transcript_35414:46-903(+)
MSKRSSSSGRDSDLYNPSSKYEEFTEVQGLTLYEIYREPRRGDPSSTIRLDINDINAAFQCPICLGYIKNCRTVMECLHRFCEDCIEKYIRLGKKECPQCRKPVPSRRSLRTDKSFDALMRSIHGDVDEIEKYQEEKIVKANMQTIRDNATIRRKSSVNMCRQITRQSSVSLAANNKGLVNVRESEVVDLVLRKHNDERNVDRLRKEYLRVSKEITVEVLKKFLGKKLSYSYPSHFQVLALVDDNEVVLPEGVTLNLVLRDICDSPDKLELYYRLRPMPEVPSET